MTVLWHGVALAAGPQPLGVFPPPASLLVLPDRPESGAALEALRAGDLDGELPAGWEFFRRAACGDVQGALAALDALADGAEPSTANAADALLLAYDRFVLAPDPETLARLERELTGDLALLLACAAFSAGLSDRSPSPSRAVPATDPSLDAVAWMIRAAAEMEEGRLDAALAALDAGIGISRAASPLLAAQLLGQRSAWLRSSDPRAALAALREAVELARGGRLRPLRVDLCLALGSQLQESAATPADTDRGGLLAAIDAYREAIHCGLSLEDDPEDYALAQNNLGLLYLALPMREAGDPLRMGVAVQSFREALEVFRRETHPEEWSSARLNLANALQYLPSSHPEENLIQAVEIYEELLGVRNPAVDPLGIARLLANQANALAHLGIFPPALAKLDEARRLFHGHGTPDLAASALERAERIHERLAAGRASAGIDRTEFAEVAR